MKANDIFAKIKKLRNLPPVEKAEKNAPIPSTIEPYKFGAQCKWNKFSWEDSERIFRDSRTRDMKNPDLEKMEQDLVQFKAGYDEAT